MTGTLSSTQLPLQGGGARAQGRDIVDVADVSVCRVDGVAALERFAPEIDRLNLAAARPNPFQSAAFLRCYALRIEYFVPDREERLYLIRHGDQLIGCAAMRRSSEYIGFALGPLRGRGVRIQFLAPWDTEQPGILCAPENAELVAAALVRHICEHERGWGMLEFSGQPPGAALRQALYAAAGRQFRARDFAVNPYNEISVQWENLRAYFRALTKKMRSNISRQARRLFAAGETELVLADGAQAVTAWFDAFCDLDSRSWKQGTPSSIQRHPRRVRFYRDIAAGNGGLDPEFIGVVLDGVLVAGLLVGSNASASPAYHGAWCLEMAYDQSRADLGPGQLLLLLAVGRAIEQRHKHLNFMQNFSYFKRRWAAEPIEVVNVQLIRRLSLHNLFATLGELKRKWQGGRRQPGRSDAASGGGADRQERQRGAVLPAAHPERARELTAAALAYAGSGVRRLNRERSSAYLPFDL